MTTPAVAARAGGGQAATTPPPYRRPPARARQSTPRTVAGAGPSAAARAVTTTPEFHGYQGVILAEFVAAELLVAATPIATRRNQTGLSPYLPRDMSKLLAIGVLYFLLQLLAVGGRGPGRFGAWFGGLILLAVGVNEAANLTKVFGLFAGSAAGAAQEGQVGTVVEGQGTWGPGFQPGANSAGKQASSG